MSHRMQCVVLCLPITVAILTLDLAVVAWAESSAAEDSRVDLTRARELSRKLAIPRGAPSARSLEARALRRNLSDLRSALRALEQRPDSQEAKGRFRDAQNRSRGGSRIALGGSAAREKLRLLLDEIDSLGAETLAGPGSRGRLKQVLKLLDDALVLPKDSRGLTTMSLSSDEPEVER